MVNRYGLAVGAVVLAALVVRLLWTGVERSVPTVFVAAVLLATWRGGLGPGLLATALSVGVMEYFLEPPYGRLALGADDLVRAAVFVGVAGLVSSLGSRQRAAEARLQRANEQLERRVTARTLELSRSAELLRAQLAERDRMEEARAGLEERLRQAQKMEAVGQLTGGVAHDFNNLLTVILGNVDRLEDELQAARPELARMAGQAVAAAERGAELTQRLLAFARRQPLQPRFLDLDRLVRTMESMLTRTLGEAIRLRTMPTPGLWAARADPGQVENALLNLALNARDAMPRGGTLTIETANVDLDAGEGGTPGEIAPGPYVMVTVTDTGVGMPPEVLARAVEPFFTTKEAGRGSGLGLSMVHGFARQSGGHVTIASEVGRGTTVRLYLPCATEAAGTEPGEPERSEMPTGSETVLVVEDEANVRELVRTLLQGLGYRVLDAEAGAAALALLEHDERVDLLFTDVGLPGGMRGRELADQARALRPGLKVLYASGYAPESIALELGPEERVRLLRKPYHLDDLARRLRQTLRPDAAGPTGARS